jgi:hypothetical protein
MFKAIASTGREDDEITLMRLQETSDASGWLLPLDTNILNFDPKLGRDHPWRIIFL